jgi:phosphatidylglycerophosphatase A
MVRMSFWDRCVEFLVTVGYIGRLPFGPGTWLSASVCLVAYFFPEPRWIEAACVVSTVVGVALAGAGVRVLHKKDPAPFVLDELAGMTLTLAFVRLDGWSIAMGFLLFRVFDIAKPLGIRRLDAMRHPSGIVWDDLLAGLYANLALHGILHFVR